VLLVLLVQRSVVLLVLLALRLQRHLKDHPSHLPEC